MIPRLLLLVLFPAFSWAQNKEIDSLKRVLKTLHDSAHTDCLNELGTQYILLSEKDSAEFYVDIAYHESKRLHYVHGMAVSLAHKSRIANHFGGDFIASETLARESLAWFEKTTNKKGIEANYGDLEDALFAESKYDELYHYAETAYHRSLVTHDNEGMFDALSNFALIHYQKGNYDSSFYFWQKAQQLALEMNDEAMKTSVLLNFGALFRAIEDYPTAQSYYRQAFARDNPDIIKFRIDSDWETWVRMEYAELFSLQGQFDSAWHYYHLFDSAKAEIKDLRIYLVSTGEAYYLQKNYDKALKNFLQGLQYHQKLNDRNEVKRTLLDIAKTYFAKNDNSGALEYAREAVDLSLRTESRQFIRDGYQILYSVYDRMHQRDSAYFYYLKYITMKEVVLSDQTKGKFAAYHFEQQIELLNKERLIGKQQLKIDEQRFRSESIFRNILIGCIFIAILFGAFLFRNIALKRRNEKLQSERAQAELRGKTSDLEMQALRAQMNPHFIFNCLNSINRFILKNETEGASDYLTKFSRLIRMVLVNSKSKQITLEDEIDMLKLYMDMEKLRFKDAFDYRISFQNQVDVGNIFIPPLLLQPFAENAIWHGLMNKDGVGHLVISFELKHETLICNIIDNGVGREAAAGLNSKSAEKQKSMGLKITKERLSLLNKSAEDGTYFEFVDLFDEYGKAAGTKVILKIKIRQMFEAPFHE
jgi:tetratricopeptide (TPR) repeat protein